jgi:hypothetical protein
MALFDRHSELKNYSWETLENVFYRKEEFYSMAWDIADLSDFRVAAAQYGGPIGELLVMSRSVKSY